MRCPPRCLTLSCRGPGSCILLRWSITAAALILFSGAILDAVETKEVDAENANTVRADCTPGFVFAAEADPPADKAKPEEKNTATPGEQAIVTTKDGAGSHTMAQAIAAALDWFKRHQSKDGSWSLKDYNKQCVGSACTGIGSASDAAGTAFGLLPFLAAGQTHQNKIPYKETIDRGLRRQARKPRADSRIDAKGIGPAGRQIARRRATYSDSYVESPPFRIERGRSL